MKDLLRLRFTILFSLFCLFHSLSAQEMVLVVERCKALDQASPIHNIWVDEENVKWVANSKGLFKVLALDLVQPASIPAGTTHLLNIRGGNAKIEWNTAQMEQIIGSAAHNNITCAAYDTKSKTIWIGTRDHGAYQLSASPLRLLQQFNVDNRKLTSNQVNDIFTQPNGTIWIATNDGMLTGSGDKWLLQERYLNFIGVDSWGQNVWILGDDLMWQVDGRGKWNAIAIEPRNVEGQLRDIAVDDEGRVWIASNMMTGFNAEQNKYQRFGPGQYFTSQFVNCLDVDQDGSIWTGTDDKGLYLIQWEAAMTVNILMETPLDCKAATPTATLQTKVTGGTEPFAYKWSSGQTTAKLAQIGAGMYQLTVTDAKGVIKTAKYEIPDPNLKLTTELVSPSSGIPAGDGSVNILVDGGSAPFTFKWDNGESNHVAVKLTTGMHTITVTDASGCSATASVNVTEKILPVTVFAKFLSSNTCADAKDGIAEVEVSGGKAPFTYQWSNNAGNVPRIEKLASGLYSVTVTDKNGQSTSTSVNIPAPPALQVTAVMLAQASANMSNGQAEAKANGGSSPYNFAWDGNVSGAVVKTFAAGMHTVTVTDANGCSATASVNVTENIGALGVIVKQPVRIACYGNDGASLKVEISGGKSPYTYLWNNGQTTATAEKLTAGNYTVTVTDAAGNSYVANYPVEQPAPVIITASVDAAASANNADGRATVKAEGGTGNFQYAWSNGEKTNKAVKLGAGTHTVTVTDGAGCAATASIDMTENILDLQVSIEQHTAVKCAGALEGAVTATVKGGKEPYTFRWSNAGTGANITNLGDGLYTLTVSDAAGQTATSVFTVNSPPPIKLETKAEVAASLNKSDGKASAIASGGTGKLSYRWSNGETAAKAVALGAGQHTVTVTDENFCTAEANVTITENILPLTATITQTAKNNCAGDAGAALQASIAGGKPPYTFQWKSKDQTWTTEQVSNLAAGTYDLAVTDASGLSGKAVFEITEPKPFTLSIENVFPASTNNADGKVILRATGGTAPYAMDGTASVTGTGNTFTIDKLKPGKQVLMMKDASGCAAQIEVTVEEDVKALQVLVDQTQQNLCDGDAKAALSLLIKGGKTPYTVLWDNGSSALERTNLTAGNYTATITDATGQSGKITYTVKSPAPVQLTLSGVRSATNDRINDGKGNAEATGGAGQYTYQWSSGENGHQAFKLPLGPGYVIATDLNGCTARSEFVIKEKALPELTATRLASGEPIRMEKIQFQADSVNVNEEAIPSLDELYEFLYDNPTVIIEVAGHTNGLPADDYCDRISAERANAVANYIINKGVEARRVIAKGYGKRKPVATNQTAEGRKKNQRVEIRLIKIEE